MYNDFYGPNGENISLTISEVQISPDLHNATVFYMPLCGQDKETINSLLQEMTPRIKNAVSKKVHLRFLPSLYFKLDDTFDNAEKMYNLIEAGKSESETANSEN